MNDGPKHIGFIVDGNRRYARKLALQPWNGHEAGMEQVKKVLKWCKELGVVEATLYLFSMQNFKRSKPEVDFLMKLFLKAYKDILSSDDPDVGQTRIRFIGRLHLLPKNVQDALSALVEQSKDRGPYTLNLAMAYGGREEITDACRAIAKEVQEGTLQPEDIDESLLSEHMYLQSEPDMIIRTSGEHRTSNFLLWQSWYSEWFFPKKMFPEFEKEDLIECIEEFKTRERRFGGK